MPSWTQPRARREAINAAVHQAGKLADAPVIGGVDQPGLMPLSAAEELVEVWSAEIPSHHIRPERDWAHVGFAAMDRYGQRSGHNN